MPSAASMAAATPTLAAVGKETKQLQQQQQRLLLPSSAVAPAVKLTAGQAGRLTVACEINSDLTAK